MTSQLALDWESAPAPRRRTGRLASFHPRNETAAEAREGEDLARRQDAWVLAWMAHWRRATPSDVHSAAQGAGFAWLLTSIRRSLSNLSDEKRHQHPPLQKHKADRRPSPRGGRECVWSLRVDLLLAANDSDNPDTGSEHSRIDGGVPPARVAALERRCTRRDKSPGHEQGDQRAERLAASNRSTNTVSGSLRGEP